MDRTPVKPCKMVGHSALGRGQALGLSCMESRSWVMPLTMVAAAFARALALCFARCLLYRNICQGASVMARAWWLAGQPTCGATRASWLVHGPRSPPAELARLPPGTSLVACVASHREGGR